MEIRDARPDDAETIARMCRELAAVTGVEGGVAMTPERVARDLIGGAGLSPILAEIDGRIAGYALYSVAYETAWSARGLYLADLLVTPVAAASRGRWWRKSRAAPAAPRASPIACCVGCGTTPR